MPSPTPPPRRRRRGPGLHLRLAVPAAAAEESGGISAAAAAAAAAVLSGVCFRFELSDLSQNRFQHTRQKKPFLASHTCVPTPHPSHLTR